MKLLNSYYILKEYRSDPLAFFIKMGKVNGHRSHLNVFGKELFIISHPDDVLHVLKGNYSAYSKGRTTKELKKFLGNGLITNDGGESWRKQHRLIRPIMNWKSVYELAPKILKTVEEFMPELEQDAPLNGFTELNRLTWRIVLKVLFSQEVTPEMDRWLKDILRLMNIVTTKTRSAVPLPFWLPTSDHREMREIIKTFDQYVYGMISERRKGEKKQDFLQLLLDAQEEEIAPMTDLEIRDEVMTFLMAGHETITTSMSWLLIELARHGEYFPILREEALKFQQSKNFEELILAPWHSAVIDEAMRLWPPVWVFMRQAEQEDRLGDMIVPKGANVVLATYLSHHSSDFWERPEEFRPERFLPEEKKKVINGSYYPFGLGPRACIGAYFAGMEARLILSTLVLNYDWEIASPEPQKIIAEITMRPANNILMRFRRRA